MIKTLNHEPVDRAPRDLWIDPSVEKGRADEVAEVAFRFPADIEKPDAKPALGARAKGKPNEPGTHTDSWGCVWHVTEPDTAGEVREGVLGSDAEVAKYQPPWDLLEEARFTRISRGCAATSRFVLAASETRPLDRLGFLRGREAAQADLAHGARDIRGLLASLHDFFCKEMRQWAETDVDGVVFSDAWGAATGLTVAAKTFRELFKPLYRDYCDILHEKDKFAFFHCAGNAKDILGDLLDVGIDALHVHALPADLERLTAKIAGRTTFWGGLDCPQILPGGRTAEVRKSAQRLRMALENGNGGVICQCHWTANVAFQNVVALFDQWLRPKEEG